MLSAVRHGLAKEVIKFFAVLRVNKRSRITPDRIRKVLARKQWPRWLTNISKEAYYVWLGMDTVAMAVLQQHSEMLKVCTDMCNTPISRRTIRAPPPPDIAWEAGRQQLFWKPFGIYESRTSQNQELLDLLDMLRSTQRHCQNPMALLVDCNMHYWVLKFLYSRATIDWNFPDWLRGISLIYGVWHPYKHVCNII